jgi:hypothetical protein
VSASISLCQLRTKAPALSIAIANPPEEGG